jgi:hypothetical protein
MPFRFFLYIYTRPDDGLLDANLSRAALSLDVVAASLHPRLLVSCGASRNTGSVLSGAWSKSETGRKLGEGRAAGGSLEPL